MDEDESPIATVKEAANAENAASASPRPSAELVKLPEAVFRAWIYRQLAKGGPPV